jgi:UDP-glucose 4-epimerase
MRVLVTGAGGFLGEYVCSALKISGHEVVRVVHMGGAAKDAIALDLEDAESAEKLATARPRVVIHLAAVLPASFEGGEATKAAETNERIDQNVFTACKSVKADLVYASGASVYGPAEVNATEESPTNPIGPYVAAKLRGEAAGQAMAAQAGTRFVSLRINAPYGPGQRKRTVLRLFLEQALKGEPLRYHGTGSREQDFTHASDVAAAAVLAAQSRESEIFNISGGEPVSMKTLAELVRQSVPGCDSPVGPSGEPDPQEGARARFSIRKARELLGWTPRVKLEAGVRQWALQLAGKG